MKKNESKTVKTIKMLLIWAVLICATSVVYLRGQQVERPMVHITLNGLKQMELDLEQVDEPYSFTVDGPGGFSNTIQVEHGRIRVESAGCPDQVCVNQGWISDGTVPIVCLPNKLVIEIKGGGGELDAANG